MQWRSMERLCWWVWIFRFSAVCSAFGPQLSRTTPSTTPRRLAQCHASLLVRLSPIYRGLRSTSNDNRQDEDSLRSKAARLRQEAQELETKLRAANPSSSSATNAAAAAKPPPFYQDLKDSIWTFSYRFATVPDNDESAVKTVRFSGKLRLHLLPDGYTDIIQHEPSVPSNAMDIVKAWGWDLETSAEDAKEYLLFSVDVLVPDNGRKERFYFQARQEKTSTGNIELKEGTVTVKQDVTETKDGGSTFWGLFSPKGILARFMYVGDFVARPASKDT